MRERERERAYWALVRYIKLRERDKEREREHYVQHFIKVVYQFRWYNRDKWWSTPFGTWTDQDVLVHLLWKVIFERKWFSKAYNVVLGIASANSCPNIRLSRDTQHKLYNKCKLFENCVWRWCCFYQFTKNI